MSSTYHIDTLGKTKLLQESTLFVQGGEATMKGGRVDADMAPKELQLPCPFHDINHKPNRQQQSNDFLQSHGSLHYGLEAGRDGATNF